MALVSIVIPTHNRREKLVRLVESLLDSDYEAIEIIIVDDLSDYDVFETLRKFPKVKVIKNEKERLLAASRNIGIKNSRGDFIFLVDDDNVVSRETITILVGTLLKHPSLGIAAPITYYFKQPTRIWCCGIKIGMVSSFTRIIGRDEMDRGQYRGHIESDGFPNAFMVRRLVFDKMGLFDEKTFPIHFDEADFGERVKKHFQIYCIPEAKIWHDIGLPEVEEKARLLHCHTAMRAYYCSKNRIVFLRKYSKNWQFLVFLVLFCPALTAYYLRVILFSHPGNFMKKLQISIGYLQGLFDGLAGFNGVAV